MKKTICLLFVVIFLFNSVGYFFVFKIVYNQAKKEVKAIIKKQVPEKDLVLIKIPLALEKNPTKDFQRIHGHEFKYKDQLFDIVREVKQKDTTWYYCIWDVYEENLFEDLDKHIKMHIAANSNQSKKAKNITKHIVKDYFSETFGYSFYLNSRRYSFFYPMQLFPAFSSKTITPPPEFS